VPGRLQKKIEEWLAENRALLWTVMSHKEMADASLRGAESNPEVLLEACEKIEASLDDIKTQLRQIYTKLYEIIDDATALAARKRGKEAPKRQPRRPPAITVQRMEVAAERPSDTAQEEPVAAEKGSADASPRRPPVTTIEVPSVASEPAPAETEVRAEEKEEQKAESTMASEAVECKVLEELEKKGARKVETKGIMLTKPKEPGGLLEFLGLWDWFWSLEPEKQRKAVSIMCEGGLTQFDLLERKITTLRPSFARYCWETANRLMQNDFDELATGLLIKGLTVVDSRHDKEMLHIMYAKYFYRRRHRLKNAYEACINHCLKVIKSYEADREKRPKPVAPFKLLTMIYEEIGEYDKILEICDRAIKLYEEIDVSKIEGFKRIKGILLQRMGKEG